MRWVSDCSGGWVSDCSGGACSTVLSFHLKNFHGKNFLHIINLHCTKFGENILFLL